MRSRNIKPGFFKNEILGAEDPFVMLTFAGLWCLADKEGKLEDRPIRIKAELFPYRPKLDVNRYLTVLQRSNFIERYEAGDQRLIKIVTWETHQRPHHTEADSKLPNKTDTCKDNGYLTVNSPLDNGGYPPDSLIPDSLIPDSTIMSGKPDVSSSNSFFRETAKEALRFLNEKTGRNYEPVEANISLITARLKEGATLQECKSIIAKKRREWIGDEKMSQYLRPATLFNKTKFAQYKGELVKQEESV